MIRIAEIIPSDIAALRALFLSVRQETFHWMDVSKFNSSDFDKETTNEHILVIHFNNTVAGFISFWQQDNFIHHLYIAGEFQKKGLGTILLQALLGKTTSPVTLKCLEKNKHAIAFYEKNGFTKKATGIADDEPYVLLEHIK